MIWMARRAARPSASGLDGVSYEIDLGQPNRARLAGAFAPFIAGGRRVSRGSRRPAADSARRQIAAPCGLGLGLGGCGWCTAALNAPWA
jgi:hypothetical protein